MHASFVDAELAGRERVGVRLGWALQAMVNPRPLDVSPRVVGMPPQPIMHCGVGNTGVCVTYPPPIGCHQVIEEGLPIGCIGPAGALIACCKP